MDTSSDFFKNLTPQDFLNVGMHQIAYIRPVAATNAVNEAATAYAVHAADGTRLSVLDSYDVALAALAYNDLQPVTLH